MKNIVFTNIVLLCAAIVLFLGTDLYAADGDLFVSGMVSIGTTTPAAQLSVKGNLTKALTGTVSISNLQQYVTGSGTLFSTELAQGSPIMIGSESFTVTVLNNTALLINSPYQGEDTSDATAYTDPKTLFTVDNGVGVNSVTVTSGGKVGIGTAAPGATLDVAGSLKAKSLQTKGSISVGSTNPGTSRANKALCWTSYGTIGYCSNAINASGICTCTQIN